MELKDLSFHLEVFSPEDAAELQLALEACSFNFNVLSVQADSLELIIGSENVGLDPDDMIKHTVIRFMIEPAKNPIAQGFEIAEMVMTVRDSLQAGEPQTAEEMIESIELSRTQEADPEMRERFTMLQKKFAAFH